MAYSEKHAIKALHEALKMPDRLYKAPCINWSGKASGGSQNYYAEIIAERLLKSDLVRNGRRYIGVIQRKQSYKMHGHAVTAKRNTSNREEEIFAKALINREFSGLGKVIDYQVPLKATNGDKGAGKIDLISAKNSNAYLIEFKYADNAETLLRAVLEIWTYGLQLNRRNLLSSYHLPARAVIKKAVLLVIGCKGYQEAKEMQKRKYLRKLIKVLGVDVFLLDRLTKM